MFDRWKFHSLYVGSWIKVSDLVIGHLPHLRVLISFCSHVLVSFRVEFAQSFKVVGFGAWTRKSTNSLYIAMNVFAMLAILILVFLGFALHHGAFAQLELLLRLTLVVGSEYDQCHF